MLRNEGRHVKLVIEDRVTLAAFGVRCSVFGVMYIPWLFLFSWSFGWFVSFVVKASNAITEPARNTAMP
jgi:hypothetical protein